MDFRLCMDITTPSLQLFQKRLNHFLATRNSFSTDLFEHYEIRLAESLYQDMIIFADLETRAVDRILGRATWESRSEECFHELHENSKRLSCTTGDILRVRPELWHRLIDLCRVGVPGVGYSVLQLTV